MVQASAISLLLIFATGDAYRGTRHAQVQHSSTSSSRNILHMTARTDEINKWIAAQGTKKDEIKVSVTERDGSIYCKAVSNIKRGDLMFSLPSGVCLDVNKAVTKFGPLTTKLRTGGVGMVALLLLSEKALGDASNYGVYIKSLPPIAPGILSWTDDDLQELYASTTRDIGSQINAVEGDWLDIVSLMKSVHLPSSVQSEEMFRWAVGTVKARSVVLDGQVVTLIPGMDFISFDPLSTSEPYSSSAGMFGGKVVKVVAERSYGQDEQVVISYGLKSSAECLEDHGVVPDIDMDEACCEITLSINGNEKYPDDKIDILERAGYGRGRRFDLEADSESDIDPALLQFLRLKLVEGKDCFILEACFADTVFNTMGQPFSKVNEIKVIQYLIDESNRLADKINATSSVESDERAVADKGGSDLLSPKIAMARLRLQERAVLTGTLNRLQLEMINVQGPDNREYYQERRLRDMNLLRPLDDEEVIMPGDRSPLSEDY